MLSPGSVIPSCTTVNICLPCESWKTLDTWWGPHSRTAGRSKKLMISWSQFWDRRAVRGGPHTSSKDSRWNNYVVQIWDRLAVPK